MDDADQEYTPPSPAYKIPFTPEEAQMLGYFTAIWGQLDFFMGGCIAGFLKIDSGAAQMLMENMTSGPRLGLFSRLAKEKLTDEALLKVVRDFDKAVAPLINKRNQIMHGMWGYRVTKNAAETIPAALYFKNLKKPLLVSELPKLIEQVADQTHALIAVWQHLYGVKWQHDPKNPPAFLMGDGPPPEWPL